ncbi:MAG: site-2 protease family protein [Acidobacteriota bacterium]
MGRIHLGTIFGTTITLDFTFIILIAFFVFSYAQQVGMRDALLWAPVLFISILIHELAHAATIGAFGFGPSAIVLGGIGGVTINQRRAKPWQDLLISAAGPASSLVLAFGLRLVPPPHDPFFSALIPLLVWANIVWGIFNLMPVGPLDGASMLRNFLRLFVPERTAFVISIWTSIVVGVLLALLGLWSRQFFLSLLMLWYVHSSYQQWQLFRAYKRPDE